MPDRSYTPGLGFLEIRQPVPRRFFDSGKPAIDRSATKRSAWQPIMYPEGTYQILEANQLVDQGTLRPRVLLRLDPDKSPTHPGAVEWESDESIMVILPEQQK